MKIIALEALTFGLNRLAAAADKFGHQLVLLTGNRQVYDYELSQRGARDIQVIEVDTFNTDAVIQVIDAVEGAVGLLSTTDTWSMQCLEVAEQKKFPAQRPEVIRLVRDKYRLREQLYLAGLSSSRSTEVDPAAFDWERLRPQLSWPCIIKDAAGTGSQNVWIAYTESEARELLAQAAGLTLRGKLTIEPFFSGTLYSVETLSWEGECRVLALTSRIISEEPFFREEAFSLPVQLSENEMKRLADWIDGVLRCVGYDRGFAHTEFIITAAGFEVVEINPRLGGVQIGEALCQVYRQNIYEAWIEMALNLRPALMDAPLNPVKGSGQIIVYAKQPGYFSRVEGSARLADHPGHPRFYPTAVKGKQIASLEDQRASIGILMADGATSEIALQNVYAARNKLKVLMSSDDPQDNRK